MKSPLTILKFGSSVLQDESALPLAVSEIYRHIRQGHRVVAVVSAFGSTTDDLLARAKLIADEPSPHLLAHLLATGEATSAAMLGLALECAGIPARKLSTRCLETEGPILDSKLVALDIEAINHCFEKGSVAILPGFVGYNQLGEECLLGRGGSDLTALFVAEQLNADHCILVKDVEGLFEHDPAAEGPAPLRFQEIRHEDALALGSCVVQPKALQFALDHELSFRVGSLGSEDRTLVGAQGSRLEAQPVRIRCEPQRVALLGLGAVGMGVYKRLLGQPDKFEIARILVRDVERHVRAGVPRELLTNRVEDIFASEASILVELIGGLVPAAEIAFEAARRGLDWVTANKAVLAQHGEELLRVACRNGSRVLFSASVGGVVPAIETIRRVAARAGVQSFEGVLNGTANFILDELQHGASYEGALAEARARGLAEADPTLDLDGTDVAHKLSVLAREAFGSRALIWAGQSGLEALTSERLTTARACGEVVKLVGSCALTPSGPVASVSLVNMPESSPLARLRAEGNGISVVASDGQQELWLGKGAGRWPTTEAVMADLFELSSAHSAAEARKASAS